MTDKEKVIKELKEALDSLDITNEYRLNLIRAIEYLQEETVSIDFEQELYKAFGQVKDFTLGMRIAKWFYEMGKNRQEPVSDLEEAATSFARKDSEGISNPANFYYTVADKARIFKAGTKWQKEQFEKNRLKHCDNITNEQAELEQGFIDQHLDKYQRMPTFLDAIEYGMNLQKEQMMAKAFDGEILDIEDNDCAMCSHTHLELFVEPDTLEKNCFKNNDKVKVVVIKED